MLAMRTMANDQGTATGAGRFPETMPSALLGALSDDHELRRRSWERIARAYHKPVYGYLRLRWRKDEEEARDIAQSFFARCLEREIVKTYDAGKARFRTFLRACLDRFVIDEGRRARAEKRGGGLPFALAIGDAEAEIAAAQRGEELDPEACFDAEWVRQVMGLALEALRAHCRDRGKEEHLRVFERYHIESDEPPSYAALAAELGLTTTDVQNRLGFARRAFRRFVLEILRDLTASEEEWKSEAQAVLGVEL
jgi:RNA polymerase sigma factor (sigma-70 family)